MKDQPKMKEAATKFPYKLHEVLSIVEKNGNEAIISWLPDGRSFKVHNRILFAHSIMKEHFNQTRFKSFQRQLNLWGFQRIKTGNAKGAYYHPLFVKERPQMSRFMIRVRIKGVANTKPEKSTNKVKENEDGQTPTPDDTPRSPALVAEAAASHPPSNITASVALPAAASLHLGLSGSTTSSLPLLMHTPELAGLVGASLGGSLNASHLPLTLQQINHKLASTQLANSINTALLGDHKIPLIQTLHQTAMGTVGRQTLPTPLPSITSGSINWANSGTTILRQAFIS